MHSLLHGGKHIISYLLSDNYFNSVAVTNKASPVIFINFLPGIIIIFLIYRSLLSTISVLHGTLSRTEKRVGGVVAERIIIYIIIISDNLQIP